MNWGNKIQLVVIGVLLVIIILMRACTFAPNCPPPSITTHIDTVELIVKKDSLIYVPDYVYLPSDTTYIPADTAAILRDYFAHRIYNDTIKIDSFGYVLVKDTVTQNRITSRKVINNYTIPIIKETTTITYTEPFNPKTQVYIGFDIGGSKSNPINYFGPSIYLKTKKDHLYNIGGGMSTDGISVRGGTAWKIKIK